VGALFDAAVCNAERVVRAALIEAAR